MRTLVAHAASIIMVLATAATAQKPRPADVDVQFRSAQQKELVDGDLKGAIAQYLDVAARAGSNRALAAQALVRAAECYRRQGDAEARRVYERVVRDYPDQKDAVTLARTRLGSAAAADAGGTISLRKLKTVDVVGTVSHDGRYLSYVDWVAGNLVLHDFVTGADRPLTNNPPGAWPASEEFAEESAISRDGARVAYGWYDASNKRYELRLRNLAGPAAAAPRRLFAGEDVLWVAPYDWSPDGKQILVVVNRTNQVSQLGLVSVDNGALRVVKSIDWRGPTKVFFSPDGRFVGYDLPATGVRQRDVYVLAVDGSRETPAVVHPGNDIMMGWSPDGTKLLFASDRNGSMGLWAVPFASGLVSGPAELLHPNIGSAWSMGVSASGALYLGVSAGGQDIEVASIDFTSGKRLDAPVKPIHSFMGSNRDGAWSPDGRYLAFRSSRGLSAQGRDIVIGVLSLETGEVRDIVPRGLQSFRHLSWSPDGRWLAVGGTDLKGRQAVYRIDAQTGAVESIGTPSGALLVGQTPQWSPDGKDIFARRRAGAGFAIVEHDLSTGSEREIPTGTPDRIEGFSVSPNGQWLAVITTDPSTKAYRCLVAPIAGGEVREIFRADRPQSLSGNVITWSRDGTGVIVRRTSAGSDRSELLFVPTSGAPPVKLDVDVNDLIAPQIDVHPDGKRLAFTTGHASTELWVLENFLPPAKTKR